MDLALVVAVVAVAVAVFAWLLPWWSAEATRVRGAVRGAEPQIDFHVGSYGGAGNGYSLNIHNQGEASAHDLQAFLPDLENPAWKADALAARATLVPSVPVRDDAPIRREVIANATVALAFKDRLGLQYRISRGVQQTRRDDGFYNFGSTDPAIVERPAIGSRAIWILRKRV